jgi:uncharacterized membrane protein YfcA
MKRAVATSLFIIAMNSLLGFIASMRMIATDWTFLAIFTSLSIVGIFLGIGLAKKIDGRKLKPIFGYLVLVMGLFIIIKEIFFK